MCSVWIKMSKFVALQQNNYGQGQQPHQGRACKEEENE